MHVWFTGFCEESPVLCYSQWHLCHHFGDESINKWNLCQMEHILHSMDLSMDVSQSFGKWKVPIMSTLTQSESTLSTLAILNPSRSKWGMTLPSGSLFHLTKLYFIIPNVYSTGTLYFGRLWSSFLKDKTKMLIANKVPAKHHWSPEACLQLCQGFHNMLVCISLLCRVLQKK